jgi:hypothetical protein
MGLLGMFPKLRPHRTVVFALTQGGYFAAFQASTAAMVLATCWSGDMDE